MIYVPMRMHYKLERPSDLAVISWPGKVTRVKKYFPVLNLETSSTEMHVEYHIPKPLDRRAYLSLEAKIKVINVARLTLYLEQHRNVCCHGALPAENAAFPRVPDANRPWLPSSYRTVLD